MDAATITALCTGIVTIIAAVFAGLASLKTGKRVDEVHKTVNGQASVAAARTEQLTVALSDAGVPVPPSPPPPPPEPPAV